MEPYILMALLLLEVKHHTTPHRTHAFHVQPTRSASALQLLRIFSQSEQTAHDWNERATQKVPLDVTSFTSRGGGRDSCHTTPGT
jgi:hypothetical protein